MSSFRVGGAVVGALTLTAVIGSASPIAAQDPSFTPEQVEKLQKAEEFLANQDAFLPTVNLIDAATLPRTFPIKEVAQHVVVDVAFGDDPAVPFMFDTGAPTLVSKAIQEKHALETVVEIPGRAGGGTILFSPTRRYPALTVGDTVTITDVLADDPWQGGDAFHCITDNGLFGASSMAHAVWQIDYGTGQVSVAASVDQLQHIDGATKVPFTINDANKLSPTPHLTLGVGSGTVDFILDTGGGIPMAIEPTSLEAIGVQLPAGAPTVANLVAGAAGNFESDLQFARLPIKLGDTELNVPVAVAAGMGAGAGGNIGHAFLKNFVVTIDWPNSTAYLDPLFTGSSVPDMPLPPAVNFGLVDGKLLVTSVVKGGAADQAGVKLGDVVTKVDGQDVTSVTADDVCALTAAGAPKQSITTESGTTYDASPVAGFHPKP